jgi:hypothetical protein
MIRAAARRSGRTTLALALACALLAFTTIYRHSSGFSPATATRCHSLSTDHTDARTLFDGDFGPLAILTAALRPAAQVLMTVTPPPVRCVTVAPRLGLLATPFRRPPPALS